MAAAIRILDIRALKKDRKNCPVGPRAPDVRIVSGGRGVLLSTSESMPICSAR